MNNNEERSFTVTYAMYDEAPIACQGDDDQSKIRVIADCVDSKVDVHAEALKHSIAMSKTYGKHVQVWDVQVKKTEVCT
jgi:hypothetical protein